MSENKSGSFRLKSLTKIDNLEIGSSIPESDITVHENGHLYQFEHVEPTTDRPLEIIHPGSFSLENTNSGLKLTKFNLRNYELLKTIDNTTQILSEANKFFSKLEVYKHLGRDEKRAILVCSPPGVGKTAAINDVCQEFLKEQTTSVIIWDTSSVKSSHVNRFFLQHSEFHKSVKKHIFVIEDISGGTTEEDYGPRGVDSSLLNLLDGFGTPFKGVPTFIIATTNNPEQSVGALIDRPQRFDKVLELKTPDEKGCFDLLSFICKRSLSEEEIEAAKLAAKNNFSIAHLQEVVVRSLIDDVSMLEAAKQLAKHKERFKNSFQDTRSMGIGLK